MAFGKQMKILLFQLFLLLLLLLLLLLFLNLFLLLLFFYKPPQIQKATYKYFIKYTH